MSNKINYCNRFLITYFLHIYQTALCLANYQGMDKVQAREYNYISILFRLVMKLEKMWVPLLQTFGSNEIHCMFSCVITANIFFSLSLPLYLALTFHLNKHSFGFKGRYLRNKNRLLKFWRYSMKKENLNKKLFLVIKNTIYK